MICFHPWIDHLRSINHIHHYKFNSNINDKMICDDISCNTLKFIIYFWTFFKSIFLMKMYEFGFRCHWSFFPTRVINNIPSLCTYWLGVGQATSHCLNQWWLIDWRLYASLRLIECFEKYRYVFVFCVHPWHCNNMPKYSIKLDKGSQFTGNLTVFDSLFCLTTHKPSKLHTTGLLRGKSTSPWWISHTKGQ